MKINWKVRLKQKEFLVAMFSAILLAAQAIGNLFGFTISETIGAELTVTFNAILSVLTVSGIVIDPTTNGVSDSENAMEYEDPK